MTPCKVSPKQVGISEVKGHPRIHRWYKLSWAMILSLTIKRDAGRRLIRTGRRREKGRGCKGGRY